MPVKIETELFGLRWRDFVASTHFTNWKDPLDLINLSMSLQSDAQEKMEHGDPEGARKLLNLSKRTLVDVKDIVRELENKLHTAKAELAERIASDVLSREEEE